MKKHLLGILLAGIIAPLVSLANSNINEAPFKFKVLNVDNTGDNTLIFIAYSSPNEYEWKDEMNKITYSDSAFIRISGSQTRYRLLSGFNMPISTEAEKRYVLVDKPNQTHHFVLQFEKIPEGASFDIINRSESDSIYNCYNINSATKDVTITDINEFIAGYPTKEYGEYALNGSIVSYVRTGDIVVNIVPSYINQYGKYFNMDICVQNFSNKSILFDPSQIKATTHKIKKERYNGSIYYAPVKTDLKLLSYEEYDNTLRKEMGSNSNWVLLSELLRLAASYDGDSYVAESMSDKKRDALRKEHQQIREHLGEGYVKLNTIRPGQDYSGYFNIKYEDVEKLLVVVNIAGQSYPFVFDCTTPRLKK